MFVDLLAWPDKLPDLSLLISEPLRKLAVLMRLQRFAEAEARLLAHLTSATTDDQGLWLLLLLRFAQRRLDGVPDLLERLTCGSTSTMARFVRSQFWLQTDQLQPLQLCSLKWWEGYEQCLWLRLAYVSWLLSIGELVKAELVIGSIGAETCMELVRFQARIHTLRREYKAAATLLLAAAERFPQHLGLQAETAAALIEARSRDRTIPFMRQALQRHGNEPELMQSVAQIKLLQREPGQARRCRLVLHAAASVRLLDLNPAGLVVSYEQTGHVEWMPHLHPLLRQQPVQMSAIQHNLCTYLASMEAQSAEQQVRAQVRRLTDLPEFAEHARAGMPPRLPLLTDAEGPLTVAWLTGDLVHHPVSRFLLGFFKAGDGAFRHRHLLVDIKDHESESVADRFDDINGVQRLSVGHLPPNQKLAAIREHQAHIAIDLSGWTDGNFVTGFMARMAPLQINYLGYFASTGIPAMDAWLGDAQLFPSPMQEWHQEAIVRLPRCFIAWQPPAVLPEGQAVVGGPPTGGIRFGSFNHNRKLSDTTLRLWGRLLASITDSRLVLKAHQRGDEATQTLLRRRMLRQGLDPERVIWLPIAPTPDEHLLQYSQMDVALDCFPNGGCTTTCEALWMGVPVITLTGSSYVSRMSTAVLHGAGLPQLCAASQESYLQLAQEQAGRLGWLRQNRENWRSQLQASQLGDAVDLMRHVEICFSELYRSRCSAAAASV